MAPGPAFGIGHLQPRQAGAAGGHRQLRGGAQGIVGEDWNQKRGTARRSDRDQFLAPSGMACLQGLLGVSLANGGQPDVS